MTQGAAIIVPRRGDGGHRDRLWSHVRRRLEADGFRTVEGEAPPGTFNRSAALNIAADAAGDAEVLVVYDGDTLVARRQIASAIEVARATGRVAFGFGRYAALNEEGTEAILGGFDGSWEPFVAYEFENTASSCLAVRRDLWELVGGFDESFVGWGWEDVAFSLAVQTIGGGMHRVAGTAWHLWHEPSPDAGNEGSRTWQRNRKRCRAYQDADGDRDRMLEVLAR